MQLVETFNFYSLEPLDAFKNIQEWQKSKYLLFGVMSYFQGLMRGLGTIFSPAQQSVFTCPAFSGSEG